MSDLREYLWDAVALEYIHGGIFHVPEGRKVDVTDPCYDRDVWCRTSVEIPAGDYVPFKNVYDKEYTLRVAAAGIITQKMFAHPSGCEFEQIAEVGVDAGLMGFFIDKPDYDEASWRKICDELHAEYERSGAWPMEWETPEGFFTQSGFGDGGYPLFRITDAQGETCGLMVVFIDCYTDIDDEEEEE